MAASPQAVGMAMAAPVRPGPRECVAGPDLFAAPASPLVLIDDAQGGFRYWPGFVDPDTAQAWFEALRDGVAWESLQRPMYDRVVDVMEELFKFTLLTRDVAPYLVDRYSERKESAEELSRRVNQRAI